MKNILISITLTSALCTPAIYAAEIDINNDANDAASHTTTEEQQLSLSTITTHEDTKHAMPSPGVSENNTNNKIDQAATKDYETPMSDYDNGGYF